MSLLYLTGSRFNVFGMGGTVSVSPTAATVAPASNLYDSDPGTPHIAGSIAADSYMRVQYNALTNPGFETSTLSGWTAGSLGTGTSAETTTAGEFRSGSKALELTGTDSSNYGSRYQTITVAAGEYRKATFYGRGIGAGTGKLYLYNKKTGNYYNGSAWASTRAAAASSSSTAAFPGSATTVTYQIEDFDTCRADTVSLRWELACESGDFCFDDVLDVSGVTFAGIFGHNYGNVISPLVQSSDDGSAWTTRATMTIRRPAFYSTFSIIYAEYWQIKLSGTPHEAPYTGEAVLGQYATATSCPEWGLTVTTDFPGVRNAGATARVSGYNFSVDASESLEMTFESYTLAEARELSNLIWLRSANGLYPVVAALTDTVEVFYGRPQKPFDRASPAGVYACSMNLKGDPFPTVGL